MKTWSLQEAVTNKPFIQSEQIWGHMRPQEAQNNKQPSVSWLNIFRLSFFYCMQTQTDIQPLASVTDRAVSISTSQFGVGPDKLGRLE